MPFPSSDYPLLYQVNTRVWLNRIGAELGRPATLDDLPEAELDEIARRGFDWVYFLGVWQTGEAGRRLSRTNPEWLADYHTTLADLTEEDICGSPFAVTGYTAHPGLGGDAALQRLHERINQRGLRLLLDFIPNHTASDHPWVFNNPEYYLPGSEALLAAEPENYSRLPTVQGERILARGRDPYFPGWPDTLQLNYANPDLHRKMQTELVSIASLCDGLRCDMAMLVLPEVFERIWGVTPAPFWPAAISAVCQVHPDFIFMAEVYWNMELQLLEQGFDYTYDKPFYDRLVQGNASEVIKLLQMPLTSQHRSVRFLENHDEARAAAVYANQQHKAAAVITYLSPCLRFFHQGQLEGFRQKISVHLCRGPLEPGDPELKEFYARLLTCFQLNVLRQGDWQLLAPQPAGENNLSHQAFIAYAWSDEAGERILVVVNYAPEPSQCSLTLPFIECAGRQVLFSDCLSETKFEHGGNELSSSGFKLDFPAWGNHVFRLSCK